MSICGSHLLELLGDIAVGTACYRVLARAFREEGVDTVFSLTGDGNMYWEAAFAELPGARTVGVRHEHCAAAMATAYARMTDTVGVASVTCGPGVTQITTALGIAVQARIPLVVLAGESPLHAGWFNQAIDQAPLVTCTGARYIAVHSLKRLHQYVAEAFYFAKTNREPVVLGVPFDLQKEILEDVPDYVPSSYFMPDAGPRQPHPDYVRAAAERILAAERVVVLGGRGARLAGATEACAKLAELTNGALATTLTARGLFTGYDRDIGAAGSFTHPVTREAFETSDLVVAVGAALNNYTSDAGLLFKPADVIQIDSNPSGFSRGRKTADQVLAADARLGVEALVREIEAMGGGAKKADWGVQDRARRVRTDPVDTRDYPVPDGTCDPRDVVMTLDRALPKDWAIVNSSGHCSFFTAHIHDQPADRFLTIREFGAIGNGLPYSIGMAMARPDQPTVLLEGDGGMMMHIQELETVRRYGWKILFCILNDGAYGAEIHKLRADGLDDRGGVHGRNDMARLAEGFGLRGKLIRSADELPAAIEEFRTGDGAMLLDIQISDEVISPRMFKATRR